MEDAATQARLEAMVAAKVQRREAAAAANVVNNASGGRLVPSLSCAYPLPLYEGGTAELQ